MNEWQTLKDSNLGMLGSKPSAVDRLAKRLHSGCAGQIRTADLERMKLAGTTGLPCCAKLESYAGFEPASTRMKTLCPEPLDEYDVNRNGARSPGLP